MSVLVAVTKEDLQAPGYKLARSIRDDGGQFDSICPSKAFLMGTTYFPFTVRSSSSRLGWGLSGSRCFGKLYGSQSRSLSAAPSLDSPSDRRGEGRKGEAEKSPAATGSD